MGMFDTFVPARPMRCPRCDAEIADFQSKEGPCGLLTFKQGDRVRDPSLPPPKRSEYGWRDEENDQVPEEFDVYTSCRGCKAWIEAHCKTREGVWTTIEIISAEPIGGSPG